MEASSSRTLCASFGVDLSSRKVVRNPNACTCSTRTVKFNSLRSLQPRRALVRTRVATDDPTSSSEADAEAEAEVEAGEDNSKTSSDDKLKVEESISLLKTASRTKKVPATEVFAAIKCLGRARLDSSNLLETLGGSGTPRCWMLVFTAGVKLVQEGLKGGPGGGSYFPVTAVQQYNAATRSIQNGVYLGPLGALEFIGRFSMSKNRLFFTFDTVSLKVGSLGPFKLGISKKEDQEREPGKKDPFFVWFYADEEIVVGKGRGGGVALWVRCKRVAS